MRSPLVAAVLALAAAAPAAAQVSTDPAFHAAAAQDYAATYQRAADFAANPAYLRAVAPDLAAMAADPSSDRHLVDPFRHDWAPARGDTAEISYKNRYGATIRGRLWGPKDQRGAAPAVVVDINGSEEAFRGIAQGLAEAGYVVLVFEVQGRGDSDVDPAPEFCRPGRWQEPQELGIRERGACAGKPRYAAPGPIETALTGTGLEPVGYEADIVPFLAEAAATQEPPKGLERDYEEFRANFVFGAYDAVDWLRSPANPWRNRIQPDRIGIAGHSAGADGALQAANGDPSRFRAAVVWDTYGGLLPTVEPSVPTMLQVAEQQGAVGPYRQRPNADAWSSIRIGRAFREAGVPSATIALRGSGHGEWAYDALRAVPVLATSRLGERVGLHYTLAWFDRWLKPGKPVHDDARARLLAERFDDSADRSSIGAGTASVTGENVPYKIKGLRTADHLSRLLPSAWSFDGARCDSTLAGC